MFFLVGKPFAVERPRAKSSDHASIVIDGEVLRRQLFSQLTGKERRSFIERVAGHRTAEIAQQAAGRFLIKHDRHAGGVDFSRAQPSDRPLGRFDPMDSGRTQLGNFRWTSYQASRCIAPESGSIATGDTDNEKLELWYSPTNP